MNGWKLLWTARLAWILYRQRWGVNSLWQAYRFAGEDCWQEFRLDGYTPAEAFYEDASYACAD